MSEKWSGEDQSANNDEDENVRSDMSMAVHSVEGKYPVVECDVVPG